MRFVLFASNSHGAARLAVCRAEVDAPLDVVLRVSCDGAEDQARFWELADSFTQQTGGKKTAWGIVGTSEASCPLLSHLYKFGVSFL